MYACQCPKVYVNRMACKQTRYTTMPHFGCLKASYVIKFTRGQIDGLHPTYVSP